MLRSRDDLSWQIVRHASPQVFLGAAIGDGLHSVRLQGAEIDIYVEDRESDVVVIYFNAAVPERFDTYPYFSGARSARNLGVSRIAISDPVLACGDIDLGWYLGTRVTGPLPDVLGPMIRHAVKEVSAKRVILFGASGGGYAAMLYAPYLPNSVVLAVNPRMRLFARPTGHVARYLAEAHEIRGDEHYLKEEMARIGPVELPGRSPRIDGYSLLLYQNVNDSVYYNNHVFPYVSRTEHAGVFVRYDEGEKGHKPIPGDVLHGILRELISGRFGHYRFAEAGFHPVRASARFTRFRSIEYQVRRTARRYVKGIRRRLQS